MNLRKLIFTENACYKSGSTIDVKGIMVHSTGANNPWLKRYVGPDDGILGHNQYDNHWNQYYPDDRAVCPHAFIGRVADGSIATYQVLPWEHRAWHCGGKANDTHISFEICEDRLTDGAYFSAVYKEAAELSAYIEVDHGNNQNYFREIIYVQVTNNAEIQDTDVSTVSDRKIHIVRFIRRDHKPNENYCYNTLKEAMQHYTLFKDDDSELYKEISVMRVQESKTEIICRM